ncbi:hypothetical protein D8674_024008 [Pyrus ussuriensis x Pyrus communis]|uniref:Uncharacterized protein n=1 Tax=Pyrus ussuriensis x Pyrus communis TaxID=2448454 RepID=A0A5N5H1S3_9ROSA|nr:hypothetical protein D8674_024008 [Pyrus ussuriensis x Pyrus communis]
MRNNCPTIEWRSWEDVLRNVKKAVMDEILTNYNLEDMDENMFAYLNRLFSERYKQWKGCPKELEDRQDSWKKAKANKINREKKTLLHHSGSRPFSYRMEARWKEGSKFPEIDIFANVYVRHGDELTESLHVTMVEKSQLMLQESASQLPLDTPIESVDPPKDARFHIRLGTYCRGMRNARWQESRALSSLQSKGQVTTLAQEVAGLRSELALYKSQISMLVQALSSFRIHLPSFSAPSPSQPFHTKQAQQSGPLTSDPVPNQWQDSSNDIPIDFSAFFFHSFVPAFF